MAMDGEYRDSYKRYKSGTNKLIGWLAATADYGQDLSNQTNSPTIRIRSRVLPELAKQIVASRLPVPKYIFQTLRWVISERKECASIHRTRATGDAGHLHFLNILERVERILRGHEVTTRPLDIQDRTRENAPVQLANFFAHLGLHEPAELDEDDSDPPSCVPHPSTDNENFVGEEPEKDDLEENTFACHCFLRDWHAIKQYVGTLWSDYRDGKLSLITAAVTSNAAFDTIERLHYALSEKFPKYKDYEGLEGLLLEDDKLGGFPAPQNMPRKMPDRAVDLKVFRSPPPGRECFALLKFMSDIHKKDTTVIDFPDVDSDFDWTQRCAENNPTRDPPTIVAILARFLRDMRAYCCALDGIEKPLDQLTLYASEFYETNEVTVRLVLACEIFVDMFFILQQSIVSPFAALGEAAKRAVTSLKRYDVHARVLGSDLRNEKLHEVCGALRTIVERCVERDMIAEFRLQGGERWKQKRLGAFCLLKHHPILCGIMRLNIDQKLYHIGTFLATSWNCVLAVTHMYNAARQRGYLSKQWPDLEAIIGFYGPSYIFVGERGVPDGSLLGRLQLAFGVPKSAISRKYRMNPDEKSAIGVDVDKMRVKVELRRALYRNTPLLGATRNGYMATGGQDADMVLRRMEQAVVPMTDARDTALRGMEEALKSTTEGSGTGDLRQRSRQCKDRQLLTPLDLLKQIRHGVQAEEYQLQFDFMEVNLQCMELLRRFKHWTLAIGENPFAEALSSNKNLCAVVQTVLIFEKLKLVCRTLPPNQEGYVRVSLLEMAAGNIEAVIDRDGSKASDKARALCPAAQASP